jgi:hypothetical protein
VGESLLSLEVNALGQLVGASGSFGWRLLIGLSLAMPLSALCDIWLLFFCWWVCVCVLGFLFLLYLCVCFLMRETWLHLCIYEPMGNKQKGAGKRRGRSVESGAPGGGGGL